MNTFRCHHCLDPVPQKNVRADNDKQFCCHGCEIAYSIINEHHAEDFYRLREQSGTLSGVQAGSGLQMNESENESHQSFASDAFADRYVRTLDNGLHAVTWYVQGAHCAACVWLLERLHLFDPAIHNSRLQIGSQQLITYYNPEKISPADIADILARLGYQLLPWHSPQRKQQQIKEQQQLYIRFAIACCSMIACMHVSWNILAGEFTEDLSADDQSYFAILAGVLSLPAICYSALPWYRSAWQSVKRWRFNLDASISSILLAGTGISFWHLAVGRSDIYFDSMAMFVCFLLGGRLVLYLAQQRVSQDQNALTQLLPLFAEKYESENTYSTVAIEDIEIGDRIKITAGQRAPVDGMLIDDHVLIDNALLSGEHIPVEHMRNTQVFAGARILEKDAHICATSLSHNSRIAGILANEDSIASCGPGSCATNQDISEYILQWFTPVVIVLGLVTWLIWAQNDPARAWDQAIAVFIVACPCALGIASPLAQSILMHTSAQLGILINNPNSLLSLHHAQHIVFDKTGTLSNNNLELRSIHLSDPQHTQTLDALIPDLLNACRQSQHPIAAAIIEHYHAVIPAIIPATVPATITVITPAAHTQAITIISQGFTYESHLGSLRLQKSQDANEDGCNHSDLFLDDILIAQFVFSDHLRLELKPFLEKLRAQGYLLSICSGDLQANAERSGAALGFAAADCHGDCSPEDKQAYIRTLQNNGTHDTSTVLMIGDGINDALALDQADLSIGVRGGLEAAMQHSDIYMSQHIEKYLPHLWCLAQQHRHCLHSCLIISLLYNLVGITAAMLGYWGPFICALAMPISSISIIILAWNWPRKNPEVLL